MALDGGRPYLQHQEQQLVSSEDLGDLSWLGSFVSPGGGSAGAAADGGRRPPPRTAPHDPSPASLNPSLAPFDAQSLASQASPLVSVGRHTPSSHSFASADPRRRTSSGPMPASNDSSSSYSRHADGLGLPSPAGPVPRGPNGGGGGGQQARSPVHHSPSASHGSFFAAFRRPSNPQLSTPPGGRAHSPATSTSGESFANVSPGPPGSGYTVPVITDEHALNRSRTLAKQLLGPSRSPQQRSRSRDVLGATREVEADVEGDGSKTYQRRSRHATSDAVLQTGASHGYSVSVDSHGQALPPPAQLQQQRQPPSTAPARGTPRPRVSSTTAPRVPELVSEPGQAELAGARVVRIDGRLFRFDATGDRLDFVSEARAQPLPPPSPPSLPADVRARQSVSQGVGASTSSSPRKATSPDLSRARHGDPPSEPSPASSTDFYGDVLGYRFSELTVDSPVVPTAGAANQQQPTETLLSPSSIADSRASGTGSNAQRSESLGTTFSDSLSTAEVELVQSAVHAQGGERAHVVELKRLPPPGDSLLLAATNSNSSRAPTGQQQQSRPDLTSPSSGSNQSSETISALAASAAPASAQPSSTVDTISEPGRPPLPFEKPQPQPRLTTAHGQEPSDTAPFHSARSSASTSQRPTPPPLVIPDSASDPWLTERIPSGAPGPTYGARKVDPEDEDDKPLALRLQKLQNRDSSPAVLVSPVHAGSGFPSPPASAADRPPALPSKSPSMSSFPTLQLQQPSRQQQQHASRQTPTDGRSPAAGVPRDPYEVLSRPMPKELDTSAQMREKLMRSMTSFKNVAKKNARSRMDQVVDAARQQLGPGSPLTAPHLGVARPTSSPSHGPASGGGPSVLGSSSISNGSSSVLGHGLPSSGPPPPQPGDLPPPRPPSPPREALSPRVFTSDSLARRMAEVEDEDERKLAENMYM